jgi:hypothetical protein
MQRLSGQAGGKGTEGPLEVTGALKLDYGN